MFPPSKLVVKMKKVFYIFFYGLENEKVLFSLSKKIIMKIESFSCLSLKIVVKIKVFYSLSMARKSSFTLGPSYTCDRGRVNKTVYTLHLQRKVE